MKSDIQTTSILRGVLVAVAVSALGFVLELYPIDPSMGELLSLEYAFPPLVVLATILATLLVPADAVYVETR